MTAPTCPSCSALFRYGLAPEGAEIALDDDAAVLTAHALLTHERLREIECGGCGAALVVVLPRPVWPVQ